MTKIPQLTLANSISNTDQFILRQGSVDKRIYFETIVSAIGSGGDFLPTQGMETNGLYLKSADGEAIWASVDVLPDQTDNANKVLTTNGSDPSWTTSLADASGTESINISGRYLTNDSLTTTLDWQDCGLRFGGNTSVDWANRLTIDASGNNSIDWGSRILLDSNQNQVVNWEIKQLLGNGNTAIDWSDGDNLVITYNPDYPDKWAGTSPANYKEAIERLTALLYTLNSDTPIPEIVDPYLDTPGDDGIYLYTLDANIIIGGTLSFNPDYDGFTLNYNYTDDGGNSYNDSIALEGSGSMALNIPFPYSYVPNETQWNYTLVFFLSQPGYNPSDELTVNGNWPFPQLESPTNNSINVYYDGIAINIDGVINHNSDYTGYTLHWSYTDSSGGNNDTADTLSLDSGGETTLAIAWNYVDDPTGSTYAVEFYISESGFEDSPTLIINGTHS